ncbi:MAG TPA: spore germination protein GerW family protein [Pilimelia sp.]|nr:spore germination protein GerW family protein [Pilimelia sp.]
MTQTTNSDAEALETVREIIGSTGADKVFGTPVNQDGVIVLPVARISGGGGGGGGSGPAPEGGQARGTGGGVGVTAKPLGVFVIKNGDATWRPAIDVGRVILGGQIVAIVALLTIRAFIKARRGDD